MNIEFDDLKNKWNSAKKDIQASRRPADEIISLARRRKRSTLYHQFGNMAILALVLVMVVIFLEYLFPFQTLLSKVGVAVMECVLVARIAIEGVSVAMSMRVDMGANALKNTDDSIKYYKSRKTINGPMTIGLVALYSLGFFFLLPEFSQYFSLWVAIGMAALYVAAAGVLIWQIRKGILDEMKNLSEIIALKRELTNDSD